jgi:glycerol-3-phosphate dehydrogenase
VARKTGALTDADRERIIHRYDAEADVIQTFIDQDPTLAEPMTESSVFLKAEVLYAFWGEMAMTLDDLLWRRMRIGLTAGQGIDVAPKIAQFLVERGHWDETRGAAEVDGYTQHILELNAELKEGEL